MALDEEQARTLLAGEFVPTFCFGVEVLVPTRALLVQARVTTNSADVNWRLGSGDPTLATWLWRSGSGDVGELELIFT